MSASTRKVREEPLSPGFGANANGRDDGDTAGTASFASIVSVTAPPLVNGGSNFADVNTGGTTSEPAGTHRCWASSHTKPAPAVSQSALPLHRTEPAGGVSVAVLRKLVEEGKIQKDERTICYVTGNGLKATEAIIGLLPKLNVVKPDAAEVAAMIR